MLPDSSSPQAPAWGTRAWALGLVQSHRWNPSSVFFSWVTSGKSYNLKASVSSYIKWE